MAADRAQHVATEIEPALARGDWVVCDRYVPSSLVYQGVVRGLGVEHVAALSDVATGASRPMSCSCSTWPTTSRRASGFRTRPARSARATTSTPRCARAYRDLAPQYGWVVVDANGTVDEVAGRVRDAVGPAAGRMTSTVASERWAQVVGQDRAVALLQRAAERPVHAYLLVGPRGSGIEEAARCFAAAVVAPDGNDRSWDLVLRGVHPDVVEVDPPRDPDPGGGRAADRRRGVAQPDRGRTEGDPPVRRRAAPAQRGRRQQAAEDARGTAAPGDDRPRHVGRRPAATRRSARAASASTSRSSAPESIAAALRADGVAPERAELLARLAGGRLDRAARSTAASGRCAQAFVEAAGAVDGSGGAVARRRRPWSRTRSRARSRSSRLRRPRRRSSSPSSWRRRGIPNARSGRSCDDSRSGTSARTGGRAPTRCSRASSPWRRCTATRWPVPVPSRSTSTARCSALSPRGAAAALDACREARHAIAEFNPNETLLIERLLLHLPAAG